MKKVLVALGSFVVVLGFVISEWSSASPIELSKGVEKEWSPKEDPYSSAENYYRYKKHRRAQGYAKLETPELFAEIAKDIRTPSDLSSPDYPDNYILDELQQAKRSNQKNNVKSSSFDFVERGPGNVAGRTRALLVLPTGVFQNTWLAGSASGGIWKTTDAGASWENKTEDLPNLGTNTLAMSAADPMTIYAGTGEHFTSDIDGSGLFKSTDQGETWTQIVKPGDYDAFRTVSRISVHPEDANTILVTARNSVWEDSLRASIYKSTDGGLTWDLKLLSTDDRYDDIAVNPANPNTVYVAVRRKGVLKSTDGGETWEEKSTGLQVTGRIELAISSVDTNYIWGSAQGSGSSTGADIYISKDGAESWRLALATEDGADVDFLGGQGWYDNVIEAHPFNRDIAYVGGVNLFSLRLTNLEDATIIYDIEDNGAFEWLDFVNGREVGGGFIEGDEVAREDVPSIEIRFNQGGQKAHRFTVDGRGSGVPREDYMFQDLVDIPFQVWDITNDRQLMVSFRDQQEDGEWTVRERLLNDTNPANDTREYIFPHNITYADTIHPDIGIDGGQEHLHLFLLWPERVEGVSYDLEQGPPTSFSINSISTTNIRLQHTVLSDAYNEFSGINNFGNQDFANNMGHHPDQHGLHFVISDCATQTFSLITTNDGGVYRTLPSRLPGAREGDFIYAGFGYNTTQFYGADKMVGQNRYIGGMQDNSTWISPLGEDANAATFYEFATGGDGFEAIWNNRDPSLLLSTIQFNAIRRSANGGFSFASGTSGLEDVGAGEGPFYSRLSNTRSRPDRVYTLGASGVWISDNFGQSWDLSPIDDDAWAFSNSMDIDVSEANPDVVWAGAALDEDSRLFVSQDAGKTFSPTSFYQEADLGFVSGIGTHPTEEGTAYALFSFARRAKVLKTTDFGQSWEDISGFDTGGDVSDRGFPDVATLSIFVFPNETNRIWVGSEIGIIESMDDGASWHLLESNLPSVPIYQMRVRDDQVIIATYGRGIWTVTVEGLKQENIIAPLLQEVARSPSGGILSTSLIDSEFDSIRFSIDDNLLDATILDVPIGEDVILPIEGIDLPDGTYEVRIIGYLDGVSYESVALSVSLFAPRDPVTEYTNDFSDPDKIEDFIGEGFRVGGELGFNNPAIHSRHTYEDQTTRSYQLKIPVIVQDSQYFRYRDVAIIETGQSGFAFPSINFFDFVITEGSLDGLNWEPLAPGYDSSLDPSWLSTYDSEGRGTAEMFVDQEIDLKDAFAIGDTLFIRFRLFADPLVNGWGWAIDDVEVRLERSTPVLDPAFDQIKIYPNPASDFLRIALPDKTRSTQIIMRDLSGRVVTFREAILGNQETVIDLSGYAPGVYFLEVREGKELVVSEKIIKTE